MTPEPTQEEREIAEGLDCLHASAPHIARALAEHAAQARAAEREACARRVEAWSAPEADIGLVGADIAARCLRFAAGMRQRFAAEIRRRAAAGPARREEAPTREQRLEAALMATRDALARVAPSWTQELRVLGDQIDAALAGSKP